MAYCTRLEKEWDLWIYLHVDGYHVCEMCPNNPRSDDFMAANPWVFIEHLAGHEKAGHRFPEHIVYSRVLRAFTDRRLADSVYQ